MSAKDKRNAENVNAVWGRSQRIPEITSKTTFWVIRYLSQTGRQKIDSIIQDKLKKAYVTIEKMHMIGSSTNAKKLTLNKTGKKNGMLA